MAEVQAAPDPGPDAPAPPPPPITIGWSDFDDPQVFADYERNAASLECANFVAEFGPQHARVKRDLAGPDFAHLLDADRGPLYPVRWINIWDTSKQAEAVETLGTRYGFSHRLRALMKNATSMRPRRPMAATTDRRRRATPQTSALAHDAEAEIESSRPADIDPNADEVELYFLLKDTVNYSSIDGTDKALCIGAHWLYASPLGTDNVDDKLMPPKHWLWIAICNDSTVLTFHEEPDWSAVGPSPDGWSPSEWKRQHLSRMRDNMQSVLLQLSRRGYDKYAAKPLTQSSIRQALLEYQLGASPSPSPEKVAREGTSNLFFYLFEDYAAARPLKEAARTLEDLTPLVLRSDRRNMKHKTTEIIPTLHRLSKELREFKHLFEVYENLINKIMEATGPKPRPYMDYPENRVILARSAMTRFDRLANRLQWNMLNTIEGYLREIEALSDTYFNLLQQKDSHATEKLNRSADLLAKLSVFFLPISFVTSFFGMEIEDLSSTWTGAFFWQTFAWVLPVSFLALFFFGRLLMFLTETLDLAAARVTAAGGRGVRAASAPLRRVRARGRKGQGGGEGRAKSLEDDEDE